MKCTQCDSQVSIADSKCPECGNDLLQFGTTASYERKKGYGHEIKSMVFDKYRNDVQKDFDELDPDERKIARPVGDIIGNLFVRPVTEFEENFESEILPAIDELAKHKEAEVVIQAAEREMKSVMGEDIFSHYSHKGQDVLKILRAGELAYYLIGDAYKNIDVSVKMFPFFKASEKACWIHSERRYENLNDNPVIKDLAEWMGTKNENIFIENSPVPKWFVNRRKTFLEVITGILKGKEFYLSGSARTGISIYAFGRDWKIKIRRNDLSETREFQIENVLNAFGRDSMKEVLAENLCDLQALRNDKMHKGIEESDRAVQKSRALSYKCLKLIPVVLQI